MHDDYAAKLRGLFEIYKRFIEKMQMYFSNPSVIRSIYCDKRSIFALILISNIPMNKNSITLKEAQQQADEWIRTYGVRYFNELTNMAILTEEVGELARVMARTYGEQSFKEGESPNLAEEMADVLWVLVCMANQTGVDLTEAWRQTIEKKTQRDKTRHIKNVKLK